MIRPLLVAAMACLTSPGLAGVDGGNPKAQAFYNMTDGYRIVTPGGMTVSPDGAMVDVRVDGPLTYRESGYFIISRTSPPLTTGESLCAAHAVAKTAATLFWIGRDCVHPYFTRRYDELKESVLWLPFNS